MGSKPRRFRALEAIAVHGRCVPVASGCVSRLLGLALLDRPEAGAGLLIPRCRSVHTLGMRFELDLLFLDDRGRVLQQRLGVPAGRVIRCRDAGSVLELPAPPRGADGPESGRRGGVYTMAAAMVLFVLTGQAPPILIVSLLIMAYLTGYELYNEEELPFLWKAWWVLFVLLLNVVGFAVFWIWLALRRRRARHA